MHECPLPYEQKRRSQNWEDGIIETMLDHVKQPNHLAIEIGSGDGTENMIRNLVENRSYVGLGHDARPAAWQHPGYQHRQGWITVAGLADIVEGFSSRAPDFFSLDIDSIDFWIMKSLLKDFDFRPRVVCAEYLCYYGPELTCSVRPDLENYPINCCGCSLSAYKGLLSRFGYEFFTCDSHGVNAFFYLPQELDDKIGHLPTHQWAFFSKYRKYTKIDQQDTRLEFDTETLFL